MSRDNCLYYIYIVIKVIISFIFIGNNEDYLFII